MWDSVANPNDAGGASYFYKNSTRVTVMSENTADPESRIFVKFYASQDMQHCGVLVPWLYQT